LESLGLVQTAGNERENVQGYGVEEDVGVSGGANANAGARWVCMGRWREGRGWGGGGEGRGKRLGTGGARGI
jgi:hypothetical protein